MKCVIEVETLDGEKVSIPFLQGNVGLATLIFLGASGLFAHMRILNAAGEERLRLGGAELAVGAQGLLRQIYHQVVAAQPPTQVPPQTEAKR